MSELVIYNHIPKCAGSYVRELLQASFGDQYVEVDNSSPPIEELAQSTLRCLSVEFSVGDWPRRRLQLQRVISSMTVSRCIHWSSTRSPD